MTSIDYDLISSDIINSAKKMLDEISDLEKTKRTEYAVVEDVLINFLYASKRKDTNPKDILLNWQDKHINSLDMYFNGLVELSGDKLKEKIKDVIIYLILYYSLDTESKNAKQN